ncbi:hypothetical protein ACFY1L_55675 [Streptomyces sp. NPDC001663]|uniref:hypothetical protein n=1 Tax=Streptomyces sp. NPDC001663 TaxID=3364597 RepID=UPI00368EF4A7
MEAVIAGLTTHWSSGGTEGAVIRMKPCSGFRNATKTQRPPARPWAVASPVHQAIALLESLHETNLQFPSRMPASSGRKSRAGARTWNTKHINGRCLQA